MCIGDNRSLINLSSGVDGVVAGHERGSGGRADRHDVAVLQHDAVRRQPGQVRGEDVRVVPRDVVEACN